VSLHLLVTWQDNADAVESATSTAQGGTNRAAGAARGVVHGPVVLDVARLLQPGAPYSTACAAAEHDTKRQRSDAGPRSVAENGARHIGLEHVEIVLYSENLVAAEGKWGSERDGDESAVIDIGQLATEFELRSGLQRQATKAGDDSLPIQ
jgi:hypothetical protein